MDQASSETAAVRLPETLDLSAAETLLSLLREHVQPGVPCRLDAGAVGLLTTPCAQILVAAVRESGDVVIENQSPAFQAGATDLGIIDYLGKGERQS